MQLYMCPLTNWHLCLLQLVIARFDDNLITGTLPHLADTTVFLNASVNQLSQTIQNLPASLQALAIGSNSIYGTIPDSALLPANLAVLDVSNNLLSGSLPQVLPINLTVLNASHNQLSGTLPTWPMLTVTQLKLDGNNLTGVLPAEWSAWGNNTRNSIQLSIVDTQLHGHMPRQWVQQFCVAVVRNVSDEELFEPPSLVTADQAKVFSILPQAKPSIPLAVQHASVNVTLHNKLYSFTYSDPDSLCSIPNAVRNTAIVWGIFAALLLATIITGRIWLRHERNFTLLSLRKGVTTCLGTKKVRIPKHVVEAIYSFLYDGVYFVYSQVTDVIAIHQVFSSGPLKYAYLLLAVLLVQYLCMYLLIVWRCIKLCQAKIQIDRLQACSWLQQFVVIGVGLFPSPIAFIVLELSVLLEATPIPLPKQWRLLNVDMATLYRTSSVGESLLNALPQAVLQSKLYIMGNNPSGIHQYIDTTLFLYSVVGSLLSILKTVIVMMVEFHYLTCRFPEYFVKLICLEPLKSSEDLGSVVNQSHVDPKLASDTAVTIV